MPMDNFDAGQAGGIFAGVIAALVAIGKGVGWLINWKGARERSEAARLRAWEQSLDRREQKQRMETEHRLAAFEDKLSAVSLVSFEMLGELQRLDPASPTLVRAREVLRKVFPVDPDSPEVLRTLVRRLDHPDKGEIE
jgi:hypothetical protein